ncbi:hypothetical protein EDB85DRAFT_2141985 [Lactarius pseudohatsudake]|nr:hypothetical protein EDB85DRAFT_2141985 [Lactarius pseudohatsudake]
MSLLTPPHTRLDKENQRAPHAITGARVAWSQVNEYHSAASPARAKRPSASAVKLRPVRSILKQTSYPLLPALFLEDERQVTPEPTQPLSDLHYLDGPVNKILSECSTLPDLIEAYSVLTARLRAAVQESTDSSCSWPLFQPLRKHHTAFVDAVVRDLGRALVDPMEGCDIVRCSSPEPQSSLPSPEKSPRKKRCGMNEEQVKYARDLATVSHTVIKLIGLAFTLPAVYGLFDELELGSMVTQALAIPLATELPTPNGRKTCALAIWLLQTQRLPADVLAPAKDRIAYALRRAIEGELGKEGKKGSVSDGLKAIHDLAVHEPSIFVPAFTELLPSILDNLLAPRLALRAQACHALGGLALAASQIPLSSVHRRLSDIVAAALIVEPAVAPPTTSPRTPSGKSDSILIKTLRTTLGTSDPTCAAQGPAWALCTIAALVVLLGPTLVTSTKLTNGLKGLLALSVRHKKSSVRGLACAVWRPLAWVYFRPPFPLEKVHEDEDGEEEVEEHEQAWEDDARARAWTQEEEARRNDFWKVVATMLDMGAGVSTVGARLAYKVDDTHGVSRAIALLEAMVQRGGNMCHDAVQTLCRLVSVPSGTSNFPGVDTEEVCDWDWARLLPTGLFSADPGLLTVDFASLSEEVRPVIKQTPALKDVRPLSATELWMPGVMDGLIKIWRNALTQVCLSVDAQLPPELEQSWSGLLKAALRGLQRSTDDEDDEDQETQEDDDSVQKLAGLAVSLMKDILSDPKVQLVPSADTPAPTPTGSDLDLLPHTRSNAAMKLAAVRTLWGHVHMVLPAQALAGSASDLLLTWLMEKETDLILETDTPFDARTQWAMLCAEVLVRADAPAARLRVFWGARGASTRWTWNWAADVRALVWRTFVERWQVLAKGWDEALVLLGVPFADKDAWEMSTEDLDAWEAMLQLCLGRVLDDGADPARVLDHVAGTIASTHIPTGASATRAADLLLSHLETPSEAPALLEFVNDTLVSTYPPEPRNKVVSMWLMRTVTRMVETCPVRMLRELLGALQEGLSVWVADQYRIFTTEEYAFDIVPVYQTVTVCMQSLGPSTDVLKTQGHLLESGFTGREDKPRDIVEAFRDYWDLVYAEVPVPDDGWPSPVTTCLTACGREVMVTDKSQALVAEVVDKTHKLPALEPAVSWSSSSTLAATDDDGDASDTTEMSQDSNPFLTPTKVVEPPSTPKAALLTCSPPRPSKTATVQRGLLFSPIIPTSLDFVTSSTPSRLPRSPQRSPKKISNDADKENSPPKLPSLPSTLLERIALVSPGAGTPQLGKRRASNTPADARSPKRSRDGPTAAPEDDSEAECEEVQRCLLQPTTPVPAGRRLQTAFAVFGTAPRAPVAVLRGERSPSPTPQQSARRRRRKGVFMDAVEVPQRRVVSLLLHPSGASLSPSASSTPLPPPSSLISLHPSSEAAGTIPSTPPPPPLPASLPPHGPTVRRSLRRAKSLVLGLGPQPIALTPAQRKRQNPLLAKRRRKTAADSYDASESSSSPISASLKRARMLVGSDDSMAADIDHGSLPPPESSDDDLHLGQVTPHHIVSPAPRRLSSRFFSVVGKH